MHATEQGTMKSETRQKWMIVFVILTVLLWVGMIITPSAPSIAFALFKQATSCAWLILHMRLNGSLLIAFIGPGTVLNGIAVLANGGAMPVAEHFFTADEPPGSCYCHTLLTEESNLWFLTDILPGGASIGDYLVFLGLLCYGCVLAARRLRRKLQAKPA